MLARLQHTLAPPVFADEDKTRAAGLLNAILWLLLVVAAAVGLFQTLLSPPTAWRLVFFLSLGVLALGLRWLMVRGQVRLASLLLVSAIWIVIQLAVLTGGGVQSASFSSCLVVIVIAGLLLGGRAAFAYAGLSAVAGLGLVYLDARRLIPPSFHTPATAWVMYASTFCGGAAVLYLASRSLQQALARAQQEIAERKRIADEKARLVHDLHERVKELTALHATARLLQQDQGTVADLLRAISALLPPAWQYPEITAARVSFAGEAAQTENYSPAAWGQRAEFSVTGGQHGAIEVVYLEERPPEAEGPFLAEERHLIDSLAEMLRLHFEHQQAEAALHEGETRFRSLAEAAFEGILFHEQGVILDANAVFARLTGFPDREALIGRNGLEILPFTPESRDIVRSKVRSGNDEVYEVSLLQPDGSLLAAEVQARDATYRGRQARVVAMRDITARKRAEAALERQATRLHTLHEIDRAILAAQSPEETALAALTRIRGLVPCRRASVSVFDFEAREARLLAVSVNGTTRLRPGTGIPLEVFGLPIIEDLRQGQPHLVADLQANPSPSEMDRQFMAEGLRAWLSLPLLYREELIGSLNLSRAEPGPFDPESIEVAREVADQLAIAVQQARLFAATQRRVQELAGLHEIAQAFSTLADARETFGTLVARIAQLIGAQRCAILLIDADGVTRAQAPGYGITDQELARWQWRPVDDAWRRDFLEQGYFLAPSAEAVAAAARLRNVSLQAENMLLVPLKIQGANAGQVMVMDKPSGFTLDDTRLLGVFAAQAAVVIQNARLYEAERAARLQADTLLEVAHTVSSTLSLREVLLRILQQSARVLPFVSGSITVYEDGLPTLMALAGHEGREEVIMRLTGHDLADSPIFRRLVNERRPQIIPDVGLDPDWIELPETAYIRGWMGVPLVAQERVIGILSLDSDQPRAFTAKHFATAQALAAQVTIAIQNAQLFAAEHLAHEQAEALRAATAAILQSLDLGQVLESMLEQLHRLVPYDSGCVFLVDNNSHATVRAAQGHAHWTGAARPVQGLTVAISALPDLQRVVTTRQSVLITDTRQAPDWVSVEGGEHVRAWIGVPLIAEGRVIGIYSLDRTLPYTFTEADVRLAEVLSAQGAVAIQNARLFEQVRAGREQLQALSRRLVAVQEDERRHLARELHDEIGQMLTGLKLMLSVLPRLPAEALPEKIDEAVAVLNDLTEQVHTLSLNLRPVILDDLGLTPALLWLFERYTAQTGVRVNFESVGLGERLPTEVETTTYRIVQEALTNVARYAGVAEARVRLRVEANQLRLQVQDAGRGFDVAAALASGQRAGLAGMRERAALLGGQLSVDSAPGEGTHIAVTLPLDGHPEGRRHDHLNLARG